jgi:hypothetical protein
MTRWSSRHVEPHPGRPGPPYTTLWESNVMLSADAIRRSSPTLDSSHVPPRWRPAPIGESGQRVSPTWLIP